jgi:H+-translocating NAD(P) transhydrogenase subunit alpha
LGAALAGVGVIERRNGAMPPKLLISGLLVLTLLAASAIIAGAQTPPAQAGPPAPAAVGPTTQPAKPGPAMPASVAPVVPAAKPTTHPAAIKPAPAQKTPAAPAAHDKPATEQPAEGGHAESSLDFTAMLFVFMLATFIGIGVIRRVSRLLHTPLMSLTNAISAIAVVGSILVAGGMREYPVWIRTLGAIALFCSMTNIISGFLITDRMLKMFKTREGGKP